MRELILSQDHPFSYETPQELTSLWRAVKVSGLRWWISEHDVKAITHLAFWNEDTVFEAVATQKAGAWLIDYSKRANVDNKDAPEEFASLEEIEDFLGLEVSE